MASLYFINGLVDSNWGTAGNWASTDGGLHTTEAVPTAADDVFFTVNSPNCTVNTSSRVAKSLTFTGYVSTITMSQQISVSGSVTLVAGMTIAGSGALLVIAAANLTSNGKTWPNALTLATNSITYTLIDNWTVNGLLTLGGTSAAVTINGLFTITATTSVTLGSTTGSVLGTASVLMNGTGTLTCSQTTGSFRLIFTINTAGTITFAAGTLGYGGGTLTYTAGTIVTPNNINLILVTACTLAVNGITWGTITLTATVTVTLTEHLNASGLVTLGSSTNAPVLNGAFNLNCPAGVRHGSTTGTVSGTTTVRLTGTGTFDGPGVTNGRMSNPIEFAAGGGTITIDGPLYIELGKLLFTSGTITVTDLSANWAAAAASGGGGASIQQW